ncbi:hypothetical protein V6N12_024496 [Hibiscus sabdariffa]|uniref:Uncharacterized protein n=1 Tax=Hibiscus sabdariffa TaxID=183260 RepID=A0ABR2G1J9_9ROSI
MIYEYTDQAGWSYEGNSYNHPYSTSSNTYIFYTSADKDIAPVCNAPFSTKIETSGKDEKQWVTNAVPDLITFRNTGHITELQP